MRNSAFTLIELLAVIVILAIIALIATPIVINIIEDTKTKALQRSAEKYLEALDNASALKYLEEPAFKLEDGKYDIMSDGNVCIGIFKDGKCTGYTLEIEIDKIKPTEGYIDIVDKQVVYYDMVLDGKIVSKYEYTKEECFEMNDSRITRFICAPMVYDSSAGAAVENTNNINNITDVVIPRTINGKKGTTISNSAFCGNGITNIIIPNSVTYMGESSFKGNQLTNILIPNKVTKITVYTFQDNQLTNIEMN